MIRPIPVLAIVGLLSGCASNPPEPPQDKSAASIAASAAQIQATWNVLGAIERHDHPAYQNYLDDSGSGAYPLSLRKTVSVSWTGPIEPLVEMLAREAHIPSVRVGTPPATPVLVYIKAENQMIGDVLRDAGFQAGNRAGIRVHPENGTERVELLYVPH